VRTFSDRTGKYRIVSGRIKSITAAEVELSDCTFDMGSHLKSEARQFRADEKLTNRQFPVI
jgi:hypothetical protein